MKAFLEALQKLENSKPVFRVIDSYYSNNYDFTPVDQVQHEPDWDKSTAAEIDNILARSHFVEHYQRDSMSYRTDIGYAMQQLENEMSSYFLKFLEKHMPQKHPKNTKLYKYHMYLKRYICNYVDADEAYYSTYKYLLLNDAKNLESTNIHVQNGLKILETLRRLS